MFILKIALIQVKDKLDPALAYVIQGKEDSEFISIESLLKPASTQYFISDEELTVHGKHLQSSSLNFLISLI